MDSDEQGLVSMQTRVLPRLELKALTISDFDGFMFVP